MHISSGVKHAPDSGACLQCGSFPATRRTSPQRRWCARVQRPLSRGDLEGFDQVVRCVFAQRLARWRTDPAAHVVVAQIGVSRRRLRAIIYDWRAWLIERDTLPVSILIRAIEEQRKPGVLELEWLLRPVGRIVMHERPVFLDRHHHVGPDALWCRDPAVSTAWSLRHGVNKYGWPARLALDDITLLETMGIGNRILSTLDIEPCRRL